MYLQPEGDANSEQSYGAMEIIDKIFLSEGMVGDAKKMQRRLTCPECSKDGKERFFVDLDEDGPGFKPRNKQQRCQGLNNKIDNPANNP